MFQPINTHQNITMKTKWKNSFRDKTVYITDIIHSNNSKKSQMKKLILQSIAVIFFLNISDHLQAQYQLVLEKKSGSIETFPVSSIRSIKFGTATMKLYQYNPNNIYGVDVFTWNIPEIAKYTFSSTADFGKTISSEKRALSVFPNPASEELNIAYTASGEESISIEIFDPSGRKIISVFNGKHRGFRLYNPSLKLEPGVYFCRLTSDKGTLTKTVIIQ